MRKALLSAVLVLAASLTPIVNAQEWSRFRGPNGSGVIAGPPIPEDWSSKTNLKWKLPLPGKGSSSPVVAGDRVYITCYTGYGISRDNPGEAKDLVRHLIAVDRNTGKELWRASVQSELNEDPYRGFITEHGYASSTPVIDGDRIYVLFGKSGLFAYDRGGKKLWQVDLGQKSDPARWGDASSPIIVGNLVIVNAGVLGNHFVGVDKKTGKIAWEVADPAYTNSWSTPTVVKVDGRPQLLFTVPNMVIAVEPTSGKKLWWLDTPLNDATCGSIILKGDQGFIMGSRLGRALAFRCGGSGDVTDSNIRWKKNLRSGINTPVIVGDNMYWSQGGLFYAASLETGEYVYRERLPRFGGPTGGFRNATYSSPVAVGNKIIQFARDGESYVIEARDEFKVLAHNPVFPGDDSSFSGTPAVSDGEMFMRSDAFLYCIAASAQ